jgi:hypothetical protein
MVRTTNGRNRRPHETISISFKESINMSPTHTAPSIVFIPILGEFCCIISSSISATKMAVVIITG